MRLIYFEIATQKFGRASLILSKILLAPSAPRKGMNHPLPDLGKRFGIVAPYGLSSKKNNAYIAHMI